MAGAVLCEPPCAEFVAGTALCELPGCSEPRRGSSAERRLRDGLGSWSDHARIMVGSTLVRGVSGELEDENWRLCSTTLVRGVSGELEDENWRLCSTTLVRG